MLSAKYEASAGPESAEGAAPDGVMVPLGLTPEKDRRHSAKWGSCSAFVRRCTLPLVALLFL